MLSDIMEHLSKVGKRQPSYLIMAEHIMRCENPFIVETGTMRQADNYEGDGMSTLLWSNIIKTMNKGSLLSIDIDPSATDFAREMIGPTFLERYNISIVTHDSVRYLQKNARFFAKPIDLLYLDSYDMEFPDPTPSFLHTFFEFNAVCHRLAPDALICVDDNIKVVKDDGPDELFVSKGEYIRQYMEKIGNLPIHEGYQLIWRAPK